MTTAIAAGAASRESIDWDAIPWQAVEAEVSRLQTRIVKAVKEGRWAQILQLTFRDLRVCELYYNFVSSLAFIFCRQLEMYSFWQCFGLFWLLRGVVGMK